MADLAKWARDVIRQYAGAASSLLGLTQPGQVNFAMDLTSGAASSDVVDGVQTIHLNPVWFAQHPDDAGAIMHEYAHAMLSAAGAGTLGGKLDWLSEGLADYTRDKLGLTNSSSHMHHSGPAKGGYQDTAGFLDWIDKQTNGQGVGALVQAWKAGSASPLKDVFSDTNLTPKQITTAYSKGQTLSDAVTANQGGGGTTAGATTGSLPGWSWAGGATGFGAPPGKGQQVPPAGNGAQEPYTDNNHTEGDPVDNLRGYTWHFDTKSNSWVAKPPGNGSSTAGDNKNAAATYSTQLNSWGISIDPNVQKVIDQAVHGHWNMARFTTELATTKEFQDRFPGITGANGDLKMTPTAYVAQEQSYQNTATQNGINLGPSKLGYLFKNDISVAEFTTRAGALERIRTNADMFKAFSQQLVQAGQAPKGGLTKQDLFKFVLGQGNQSWYNLYNDSVSRYYGTEAGIHFGGAADKYESLSQKTVENISGKGLSEAELQSGYKALAAQLNTTMPLSQIQKMGLSKQDLVELEFGGSRQASVALKVRAIMKNETNIEDQANKAYGTGGTNLGQRSSGGQQARAQN